MKFIVIGITDHPNPWFPPEILEIIKQGKVFSGGKRRHEIVAPLLPKGAEWVYITVPLERVFEQYRLLSSGSHDLPSFPRKKPGYHSSKSTRCSRKSLILTKDIPYNNWENVE